MSAVPARASTWTQERRQHAADRIRARKPWLVSTGPKTQAGKSVSKMNAYKHGRRSGSVLARRRALVHFLREQKAFLCAVKAIIKLRRAIKSTNAANEVMTPQKNLCVPKHKPTSSRASPLGRRRIPPSITSGTHGMTIREELLSGSEQTPLTRPVHFAKFSQVLLQPLQYWPSRQWIAACCGPCNKE